MTRHILRHSVGFWYLSISIVLFYVKLDDNLKGLRLCGENEYILWTHFEKNIPFFQCQPC